MRITKLLAAGIFAMFALPMSIAVSAPSQEECAATYAAADTNKDGVLDNTEGSSYFAFYRLANKPPADDKISRDTFVKDCASGFYLAADAEAGAPLSGANSFTEGQAKDRVMAHGGQSVSGMTKDDKGVWRGTATLGGSQQSVAVDYKGNVVFSK